MTPSDWVVGHGVAVARAGSILDLACGAGRHTRWFAARGHPVTAVDVDFEAVHSLAGVPGVTALCADLENSAWPFSPRQFQAVVVTRYLHRPLFPSLLAAVGEGGLLIYETFARGNEKHGKPSNPAYLLNPGELLDVVRGQLRVLAYEDKFIEDPWPAMIQRICARRERIRQSD